MQRLLVGLSIILATLFCLPSAYAQITQRERPKEWEKLVPGARFADTLLPMQGQKLSSDTWGNACVKPRFLDNGIEDRTWSYWGGNVLRGEDGLYHLMVAAWREDSPKGHMEWPNSIVIHAVSTNPVGPFVQKDTVGKGHNPEVFRLADGRYVIYVIGKYYLSSSLNGPWTEGHFSFDARDRPIIEGLSNLTFARREDGSFLMICRGGGVWISRTGLSPYLQISDHRIYPNIPGNFEDPVVWRDDVQYHAIVNDWRGRIAYHLRSGDGRTWVVDPGEAYLPGIARHPNGHVEQWYKYERPKVFQDARGRAIQMNFAVIDHIKWEDKGGDIHSSKNIAIPLDPGLTLDILAPEVLTPETPRIRLRVAAEPGLNPARDLDVKSLRFGTSAEVNYGGGAPVLASEVGADGTLVLTFDGAQANIGPEEFAPKLLGKRTDGRPAFGYVRHPQWKAPRSILTARAPQLKTGETVTYAVTVQNLGLAPSPKEVTLRLTSPEGRLLAEGPVPSLAPYAEATLSLPLAAGAPTQRPNRITLTFSTPSGVLATERL